MALDTAWGSTGTAGVPLSNTRGLDTISFATTRVGCAGGTGVIVCTVDAGSTWHIRYRTKVTITQIQFAGRQAGVAGAGSRLLETNNSGQQWRHVPGPSGVLAADFVSNRMGWIVTSNGGLASTTDGHTATVRSTSGHIRTVDFINAGAGWILTADGRLWSTGNGGRAWRNLHSFPVARLWARGGAQFTFTPPRVGWLLLSLGQGCASQMPYVLYRTGDGGIHWQAHLDSLAPCSGTTLPGGLPGIGGYPGGLSVAGARDAVVSFIAPANTGLYLLRTVDSGRRWTHGRLAFSGITGRTLAMSFPSTNQGWIDTGGESGPAPGRILHSANGGRTWTTRFRLPR